MVLPDIWPSVSLRLPLSAPSENSIR
jgi:hypothetical protein